MEAKTQFDGCVTHGPWGGSYGTKWVFKPEGSITKIILSYTSSFVDSIKFKACLGKTETQSCSVRKPGEGCKQTICIDCPDEYLVAISGTYDYKTEPFEEVIRCIRSISFKTNKKLYGPYGSNAGTVFSHDVEGEVIIGFHGYSGRYINAIGVYVMPKALASDLNPTSCKANITNEPCYSLPIMAMPREAGPWGAGGGKPWDDGVFSTVKQVRVHLGELSVIYALQFEYLKKDGKSVLSQIHGGADGSKLELVHLDGEEEFLMGVSGFYGPVEVYNGLEAIVSITFYTNKRTLGPFGEEKDPCIQQHLLGK